MTRSAGTFDLNAVWGETWGLAFCERCHGTFPTEDLVEGICLWDWEKED
jgi:hypothetical protein